MAAALHYAGWCYEKFIIKKVTLLSTVHVWLPVTRGGCVFVHLCVSISISPRPTTFSRHCCQVSGGMSWFWFVLCLLFAVCVCLCFWCVCFVSFVVVIVIGSFVDGRWSWRSVFVCSLLSSQCSVIRHALKYICFPWSGSGDQEGKQ